MEQDVKADPAGDPGGDRDFEAIVAAHEPALLRYAARLLQNPQAAEDVVQDTFLKLVEQWRHGTRPGENLRPWLYRVAHNAAVDYIRRESRLRRLHERSAADGVRPGPNGPATGDGLPLVLEQLRALNDPERQVLLLRLQEGLSYREIALATGRPEGTVGWMLNQAVKKISARLKEAGLIAGGGRS